jgi:hypothetical protein
VLVRRITTVFDSAIAFKFVDGKILLQRWKYDDCSETNSSPLAGWFGFRIPTGARAFIFSKNIQTGAGVHPFSSTMGTGFFRGDRTSGA